MRPILRNSLFVLALAAAAAVPLAVGSHLAHASAGTCSAHLAGLETSKKTPVELVVFNGTGEELTLDLTLLDAAGNSVLERPAGVVVGSFQTRVVSLEEELKRDLAKKEKPFEGLVAIELVGDDPFGPDDVIVHATQYFGKRKKPKGAVVFRPLFRDVE
jgi:hypothetical protein